MVHYRKIRLARDKKKDKSHAGEMAEKLTIIEGYRPALILFFIFFIFLYSPRFVGPGASLYEIARSLAFDFDIQFANERNHYPEFHQEQVPDQIAGASERGYYQTDQNLGAPLTVLPVIILTRLVELGFHLFFEFKSDTGYSILYQIPYSFVTVFLGAISIILMVAAGRRFGTPVSAMYAVIALVYSSPFLSTTFLLPGFSETIGLFWVALFFFLVVELYFDKLKRSNLLLLFTGFTLGMAICSEWLLLPIIVLSLLVSGRGKSFYKNIREMQLVLVFFFLGLLIGITPQFLFNKIIFGTFAVTSLEGNLTRVLLSIFHPRLGIIFQFPLLFFSMGGIFMLMYYDRKLFLLLSFVIIIYIIFNGFSSDFLERDFGQRSLVPLLPFLSVGLTILIDRFRNKNVISDTFILFIICMLMLWTMLQLGASVRFSGEVIDTFSSSHYHKVLFGDMFQNLGTLFSKSFFHRHLLWSGSENVLYFFEALLLFIFVLFALLFLEWEIYSRNLGRRLMGILWLGPVYALFIFCILIIGSRTARSWVEWPVSSCRGIAVPIQLKYTPWSGFEGGSSRLIVGRDQALFEKTPSPQGTDWYAEKNPVRVVQTECDDFPHYILDTVVSTNTAEFVIGPCDQRIDLTLTFDVSQKEQRDYEITVNQDGSIRCPHSANNVEISKFLDRYRLTITWPELYEIRSLMIISGNEFRAASSSSPFYFYGFSFRAVNHP
ncbi:hypothetical protein ACFL27_23645 [candidate division CSSED10-310 bacterium]|uniref:Glycosyltransferase RgtA/B/C/D-like domain-containing protein n=1 Tax=candidate division CSSED10-310 bacterium TaxID=2855610 RepID=A0ABV6Z443_UNCC1